EARRQGQAAVLGPDGAGAGNEAIGGRSLPLAGDPGRRDAAVARSALGPVGGTGLVARAHAPRASAPGGAMILVTGWLATGWSADGVNRVLHVRGMTDATGALPDDIERLKAMLRAERSENARLAAQNERLLQMLRQLRRNHFGRKSE